MPGEKFMKGDLQALNGFCSHKTFD